MWVQFALHKRPCYVCLVKKVFIACTLSLASLWCADTTRYSRRRPFLLLIIGEQVRLPTVSGSVETEACVSGSRSPPIYGVNHKTVITATLWPFLLRVGDPFFFKWPIQLRGACTLWLSGTSQLETESTKRLHNVFKHLTNFKIELQVPEIVLLRNNP